MHRILIILSLTVPHLGAQPPAGVTKNPSEAVLQVLDLLTKGEDSDAFRAAILQLANDRPPTEALANPTKLPTGGAAREDLNVVAGNGLRDLGKYVALHPSDFPDGLPKISGFKRQRQLGPFFEGLLPRWWWSDQIKPRLAALNPLIDASWLEAAMHCGDHDFHHLMQVKRGRIRNMLASYQQSGDEIGIIRLGEMIGRYPEPAREIDPRELSTRTLALFLSGAFGIRHDAPSETFILVETALGWREAHPKLMDALVEFRGDRSSMRWFEVGDLWHRGTREASLKLLFSIPYRTPSPVASFAKQLLLQANPSDEDIRSLVHFIPTEVLVSCANQCLDDDNPDDNPLRLARLLIPEFHSRKDRKSDQWIPYSMDYARKTALRWWMEGRNEDAFLLLQETFINLKPSDYPNDMLRFPAIARASGREVSVMDELEKRAAQPGHSDLALHKAAMLAVAGKHREALEIARSRPPGDLFHRFLVQCGEWDALREIASGPEERFKEKHQWLCHAAFLNRDAATARDYLSNLPDSTKEQTALLLLLSGNNELSRQHAKKCMTDDIGYHSLPFPISLNAFDIWENTIAEDLDQSRPPHSGTVLNYTRHAGMSRDHSKTIPILERLTHTGKLRTHTGGPYSQHFTDQLVWQHRIHAAAALIELGAVEKGCLALKEMEAEGLDAIQAVRNEFWNAFVPDRFNTNGFAEYLRIAELELPNATKLDQHLFLTTILAKNPTPQAVARMLALLEKHRENIPIKEASLLLQKLSIAMWGEAPAPELRSEAERVFSFYQPNAKQLEFFQRWARPAPWEDRFSKRTEIGQKPGEQFDPKSAGFRVLDGMAKIRSLLAEQKSGEAASLFREMESRILLDDLPKEKIDVTTQSNQGGSGTTGEQHPEAIPVIAALCWNLQADFLRDYALTVWRCGWDINPRYLAPFLARNGDFREARISAMEYQHGWGSNDLKIIRLLPAIDGLAHASEGRVDAALDRLNVCLDLHPFDPEPGMAILNAFKQRGDENAARQTAARIRDYWKQQLAEYPGSPQIREASHYWLGELDRNP